jgi:holin-like protein
MIRGLVVILAFLLVGRVLGSWVPVPASVLGMLLLAILLDRGAVRTETVKPASDALLRHMGIFFVPAGVAIATQADVLKAAWLPILVASIASFVVVFAVVGTLYRWLAPR